MSEGKSLLLKGPKENCVDINVCLEWDRCPSLLFQSKELETQLQVDLQIEPVGATLVVAGGFNKSNPCCILAEPIISLIESYKILQESV